MKQQQPMYPELPFLPQNRAAVLRYYYQDCLHLITTKRQHLCTCFAFFPQATCIYHLYVLAFQWRKGNGAWRMQELINKNQIPKMHQRSDVIAQQFKLIWFEYKLNYSDKTLMLSPPFSLKSSLCQQACSSSPLYRTKIMDKIYNTKGTTLFFFFFFPTAPKYYKWL